MAKLDRLTRSVVDLGALVARANAEGWAILSVSESIDTRSAAGRLVLNVLASVAEWEREAIGERTAAALAHARSQGRRVGAIPYGWRAGDGGYLVADPHEAHVAEVARKLRADGASLRRVAARLAELGYVSRSGRPFEAMQIQRITAQE